MAPTRWGIAGTGRISFTFTTALSLLPPESHQVVAVASRELARAETFARDFTIPRAHGSYQELAEDPDVDVVYMGGIHPAHYEVCRLMLENGKHVLCEKPLCMNKAETTGLLAVAKEKKRFLLEGYWSRFFPAYEQLRKELELQTVGDIKMVQLNLGYPFGNDPRSSQPELGGGATMDLGGYPIQFALLVFGEFPEKIVANGIISDLGTDQAVSATLYFSDKRVAQMNLNYSVWFNQTAIIFGTKGMIQMPNFQSPEQLITPDKTYDFPVTPSPRPIRHLRGMGMVYQAEAVRQSILNGELENSLMPHKDTVDIITIMDEIRRQLGVVYAADKH